MAVRRITTLQGPTLKADDGTTAATIADSTGAISIGSGGTNWTLPTARTGTADYVLSGAVDGSTSWTEIVLAPTHTASTWYSDDAYSSALSAGQEINIDDITYLKVSGTNFGTSAVFGNTNYVQIRYSFRDAYENLFLQKHNIFVLFVFV